MRFFTYTLSSGSIQINQSDGASFVSIQCSSSSSCTVLGNLKFKNLSSSAITLSDTQGMNLTALSPADLLDGITITHVSGTIDILIGL